MRKPSVYLTHNKSLPHQSLCTYLSQTLLRFLTHYPLITSKACRSAEHMAPNSDWSEFVLPAAETICAGGALPCHRAIGLIITLMQEGCCCACVRVRENWGGCGYLCPCWCVAVWGHWWKWRCQCGYYKLKVGRSLRGAGRRMSDLVNGNI